MEKTLDEFIVKDGDVFMVEVKFGEKWPRDSEYNTNMHRDWRNFEVGDKLDVFEVILRSSLMHNFRIMNGRLVELQEYLRIR